MRDRDPGPNILVCDSKVHVFDSQEDCFTGYLWNCKGEILTIFVLKCNDRFMLIKQINNREKVMTFFFSHATSGVSLTVLYF